MSDTLRCGTCKRDLPDDDFSTANKAPKRRFRRHACRECVAEWFERASGRNRQVILEAKDVPCMDCGVRHPFWIMQFDHRDPDKKSFGLHQYSARALQKVKDEIAKCDVVCSNCHDDRTYKRDLEKRQRGERSACLVPRGTRLSPKTQTPSLPDALTLF
jgi:hypothetical protein